jgi:hypothetical protein
MIASESDNGWEVLKRTIESQYLIVQVDLGGAEPQNIGILLLDAEANRLHARFLCDLRELVGSEADCFECLADDVSAKSLEFGAERYLIWLESTLSNTLRVSQRKSVVVDDYAATLDRLYAKHIHPPALAVSHSSGAR